MKIGMPSVETIIKAAAAIIILILFSVMFSCSKPKVTEDDKEEE